MELVLIQASFVNPFWT